MKSKILLPKGYLSWTQIDMWNRSQRQYIDTYILNQKRFENDAMIYGKKVADALETGETDDSLIEIATVAVPKYDIAEYKLNANIETNEGVIPLFGKADTAYDPPSLGFREYKTGQVPWTQKKADRHGQITLYALMVYLNEKKLPKSIHLDWLPTENKNGEIQLTGDIVTFQTERSLGELIEMMTIVKRTASGISSVYNELLNQI
jgi:hypothetical protein